MLDLISISSQEDIDSYKIWFYNKLIYFQNCYERNLRLTVEIKREKFLYGQIHRLQGLSPSGYKTTFSV